jgi:hypothetical protein
MTLKRSGFKRPQIERKRTVQTPVPEHLRRNATMVSLRGEFSAPIEKEGAIQHKGYMDAVRSLPCAHCGKSPRSEFCHSDEGKGTGIKSDCRLGWPGCHECHDAIGTRRIYHKELRRAIEAAMAKQTRAQIELLGLWPANLPRYVECNETL